MMAPRESRIVFLSVPESLRGEVAPEDSREDPAGGGTEFFIDPAIPIPVEIIGDHFNLEDLSSEMILSGMIKVIREGTGDAAGEPVPCRAFRSPEETESLTPERIGYYRRFVLALRREPENVKIISNLGVLALKSGNGGEAAAFFRTVLEMEPGDPVASAFLVHASPP